MKHPPMKTMQAVVITLDITSIPIKYSATPTQIAINEVTLAHMAIVLPLERPLLYLLLNPYEMSAVADVVYKIDSPISKGSLQKPIINGNIRYDISKLMVESSFMSICHYSEKYLNMRTDP